MSALQFLCNISSHRRANYSAQIRQRISVSPALNLITSCHSSQRVLRYYSTVQDPFRVCIVGSGPAGFYTADSLLTEFSKKHPVVIDIIEKLPVPFGLVRYGVAPDHPEVKLVTNKFTEIARNPNVGFFGNVTVGKDVSVDELRQFYDAVVFCFGAEGDRRLGIEGETLKGSHSAREFVAWYNGHPLFSDLTFDLTSANSAFIFGMGNVALDVARIILKPPTELSSTDITSYALATLRNSAVRSVHLVGRRGPVQAAFTTKELRELTTIPDCKIVVPTEDLQLNLESKAELDKDRAKKRQIELLQKVAIPQPDPNTSKHLFFHFFTNPVRFVPQSTNTNALGGVVLERTKLTGPAGNQSAVSTGVEETHRCDISFRSIGYQAKPLAGLPFDPRRGIVPNDHGRVLQISSSGTKELSSGIYVSGWLKRGPSGIIGTNKFDAAETVDCLIADFDSGKLPVGEKYKLGRDGLLAALRGRGIHHSTTADFERILSLENERGQQHGKSAEKITSFVEKLSHISKKY